MFLHVHNTHTQHEKLIFILACFVLQEDFDHDERRKFGILGSSLFYRVSS